jgi:hypothetical protein
MKSDRQSQYRSGAFNSHYPSWGCRAYLCRVTWLCSRLIGEVAAPVVIAGENGPCIELRSKAVSKKIGGIVDIRASSRATMPLAMTSNNVLACG